MEDVSKPIIAKLGTKNARAFVHHVQRAFRLPNWKDGWVKKDKSVQVNMSWEVSKLSRGESKSASSTIHVSSIAKQLGKAREAGYVNLARQVAERMPAALFEYHLTEAMSKLPSNCTDNDGMDGPEYLDSGITSSTDSPEISELSVPPPDTIHRRPTWLHRAECGDFSVINSNNCIDFCTRTYGMEIDEYSSVKTVNISRNRKATSTHVKLNLSLSEEFPLKSVATHCKELWGIGKGDTLPAARSAARVELAKEIYRVYRYTAPSSNVDVVLPPEVHAQLKTLSDFFETNGNKIVGEINEVATDVDSSISEMSFSAVPLPDRSTLDLPLIWNCRDLILKTIAQNSVTIISASRDSGKTTQVPQILFDSFVSAGSYGNVIITQPRGIAALASARRVAKDMEVAYKGSVAPLAVGHSIQLDSSAPQPCAAGSMLYCTTSMLLRRMQTDPKLNTVSHIILDEVIRTQFMIRQVYYSFASCRPMKKI